MTVGIMPEQWTVSLCGFSWEGWKRHAWADERKWVEDKVRRGVLDVIV
jgi:hypothetical protein